MAKGQHFPNPKVNRKERRRILTKRIRSIEKRFAGGTVDEHSILGRRLEKKLSDYKAEITTL